MGVSRKEKIMIESVAVVGRMSVDSTFHQSLFEVTDATKPYKELGGLDKLLNETHQLRLCKWEVMRINTLVRQEILQIFDQLTGEVVENRVLHFGATKDDGVLNRMQALWSSEAKMEINFKDKAHIELCAAIGLACIDPVFFVNLSSASRPDQNDVEPLKDLLTSKNPRFDPLPDLVPLNRFLQAKEALENMKAFRAERWVQPKPCDLGYTFNPTKEYNFLSQTEIELLLVQQPPVTQFVVQHFRDSIKDHFAPAL
jgi:hypothetical protein